METRTRAMTQAEIAFLHERFPLALKTNPVLKLFGFLVIWAISFSIVCILAIPLKGRGAIALNAMSPMAQQAALIGVSFVVAIGFSLWHRRRQPLPQTISTESNAIAEGMVREQELEIISCYRFEDFDEDYGDGNVGYLFALPDDRVLSVMGWDLRERDDLPSTKIRYATTLTGDLRVSIAPIGGPLEPAGVVQITKQHFKQIDENVISYAGPEDGVFYSGSMEQVLERFALKP